MCLLSIIIPNYNNGKFLPRCLDSILISDRKNFEVIVIDDGSMDGSISYLRDVTDVRVSCFFQENRGVSAARNVGIEKAKGRYVTFCDSDDYYDECGIDRLLGFLETHRPDGGLLVFDACIEETGADGTKTRKKWERGLPGTQHNGHIECGVVVEFLCGNSTANSAFNKIYDNTLLHAERIRFPEGIGIGEDGIFNLEYATYCYGNIYYVSRMLYVYCHGESEWNSGKIKKKVENLREIVSGLEIRNGFIRDYCVRNNMNERKRKKFISKLDAYGIEQLYHWAREIRKKAGKKEYKKFLEENPDIEKRIRRYIMKNVGVKRKMQAFCLFWSNL